MFDVFMYISGPGSRQNTGRDLVDDERFGGDGTGWNRGGTTDNHSSKWCTTAYTYKHGQCGTHEGSCLLPSYFVSVFLAFYTTYFTDCSRLDQPFEEGETGASRRARVRRAQGSCGCAQLTRHWEIDRPADTRPRGTSTSKSKAASCSTSTR